MIKNDRQYRITKQEARKFEKAIAALPDPTTANEENDRLFLQIQADALRSLLDDLQTELVEYEQLKAGHCRSLSLDSLPRLSQALIAGRIVAGLTQRELADRLGLKEQQIQRYEATDYESASLARITEIASALGLDVKGTVGLPGSPPRAA